MPGIWSRLMRVLFEKYDFVVVYLDDIGIFSRSMEEHVKHVRTVLEVLCKEGLFAPIFEVCLRTNVNGGSGSSSVR